MEHMGTHKGSLQKWLLAFGWWNLQPRYTQKNDEDDWHFFPFKSQKTVVIKSFWGNETPQIYGNFGGFPL